MVDAESVPSAGLVAETQVIPENEPESWLQAPVGMNAVGDVLERALGVSSGSLFSADDQRPASR
jgi:hypothetical protein